MCHSQAPKKKVINLDIEENRSQVQRFIFPAWFIHLKESGSGCSRRQKMLFIPEIYYGGRHGSRHCSSSQGVVTVPEESNQFEAGSSPGRGLGGT